VTMANLSDKSRLARTWSAEVLAFSASILNPEKGNQCQHKVYPATNAMPVFFSSAAEQMR
jgi:hypothetical protein